ncbi:MAG: threonine synthase [Nitrososphaerota archaeon]
MKIYQQCVRCNYVNDVFTFWNIVCCRCSHPLIVWYELDTSTQDLKNMFSGKTRSLWKYRDVLPRITIDPITLGEGGTPMHLSKGLGSLLGLRHLYIKNESTNPTGAFTDRGATLLVSLLYENNINNLTCISSGNLGVSLAAYSTTAGISCKVYFKIGVEQVKILQALSYNAEIYFTNNLTLTEDILRREVKDASSYIVSSSNPLLLEGYKTIAYEIMEDLNWSSPDWIILPVGSGANMTSIWKGIKELEMLDLLQEKTPRLIGGQIKSCAPIAVSYFKGLEEVEATTLKDVGFPDIADPNPPWGFTVLKAIRELGGKMVTVSEEEVLHALKLMAKYEGLLVEPASAVGLATLIKSLDEGYIKRDEEIILIITGSGMKNPSTFQTIYRITNFERVPIGIGETKKKILEILSERPLHGYAIKKILRDRFSIDVKLPTIYEHLKDLEERGLVYSLGVEYLRGKRTLKKYMISELGRRIIREEINRVS